MKSIHADMIDSDSSILPEDLASQSVKLKEEQLRREEEKVVSYHWNPCDRHLTIRNAAARDRAPRSARDQREEAGVVGEGRVAQVGNNA